MDDRHELGEYWALLEDGVQMKKYPCYNFTRTSITLVSALVDEHSIEPEDVESVDVVYSQGAEDALHHANPSTGLEGKFSLEYTVASAIERDCVGLSAFDDENVDDPAVQAVGKRVSGTVDSDLHYGAHRATVRSGRPTARHSRRRAKSRREPSRSCSRTRSSERNSACVRFVFSGRDRADELYDRLDALRDESDVADLVDSI